MAVKSNYEKAVTYLKGEVTKQGDAKILYQGEGRMLRKTATDTLRIFGPDSSSSPGEELSEVPLFQDTVGAAVRSIVVGLERILLPLNDEPPRALLSNNGKDLEKLLVDEANRLEKKSVLTMDRYGTTSVMIEGEWRPVPSLPDFEGVIASGRQFIIEAKVCSGPSFRMNKDKIKHKQVRHLLSRHRFNVPGYVMIHYNERLGKTFYDPPFSVAIPVKPASEGGWPVWEKYAAEKDKSVEFDPITRELAREIGIRVRWFVPPRARTARPDLERLLTTEK